MTFRADKTDGSLTQVVAGSLLGGLDTKTPAHRVDPSASPELLNVLLHGRSVSRRGGFVPLIRQQPGVGSLRNVGRRVESRVRRDPNPIQATYLSVPGCAHAGHRRVWDDADVRNGIALDLFVQIDDLSTTHGGDGNHAAPNPYTLKVRPIFSKGPIRRHDNEAGQMTGTTGWQTTKRWGPISASHHGMPFCLYLFNNAGTWEFRFSFHSSTGANWHLNTVVNTCSTIGGVRTGVRYHVIAGYDITAETAILRIGSQFDIGDGVYEHQTISLNGFETPMALCTTGPIQLFDCPQEFIEAPAADSPTRPPGLELSDGYWFASRRFEGSVEDIVIYRGLPGSIVAGALDRSWRVDPDEPPAPRLQHWPIQGKQENLVDEIAGIGNHMVLVPSGPVFDERGGLDGGALMFNGTTAYALAEQSDINPVLGSYTDGRGGRRGWRMLWTDGAAVTIDGCWERANKESTPHGIEVVCWPESIEPNNEQVVAEAHNAIRVTITHEGYIKGYVRQDGGAPPATQYQFCGQSAEMVVPGQRYHIVVMVLSSTVGQLWVNGTMEQQVVLSARTNNCYPVSGLTIGAGAREVTSGTSATTVAATAPTDYVNTDARTFFFGRVESVKAVVGSLPFRNSVDTALVMETQGKSSEQHYTLEFDRLVKENGTTLSLETTTDPVPNFGIGHAAVMTQEGAPLQVTATTSPTTFVVHSSLQLGDTTNATTDQRGQIAKLYRALAAYDFSVPTSEFGYLGHYANRVEIAAANVPITARRVHVQRGYVNDTLGLGGPVQLRCAESDIISCVTDKYMALRPFDEASPRELAPQWSVGMLRPELDANPIALLADWHHETTGEQFVIAGCRRSLYWVKPMWRKSSPWPDDGASLWLSGQANDYARGTHVVGVGDWSTDEEVVDLWVYPTRLDRNRILAMHGNPLAGEVRWALVLVEGQLHVMGHQAGGGSWVWVHGNVLTTPTRNIAMSSVKLNAWNHIAVKIGVGEVKAWIDGQIALMTNASIVYGTGLIGASAVPAVSDLWIGGGSADQSTITIGSSALKLLPFHGYITQVRSSEDLTDFPFSATTSSHAPTARGAGTASTNWLVALNQLTGWTDAVDTTVDVNAIELVPIKTDLPDMGEVAASSAVYRNRLLVVHEKILPQAIRFTSFDADAPFVAERLGMDQPGEQLYSYQAALITKPGAGSTFLGGEALQFYVSFVNSLGEESGPGLVGSGTLSAGQCSGVGFGNVPRSPDPQVVARRIYLSVGGALPVPVGELLDNKSTFFEIHTKQGMGGTSPSVASRLPAPVCRRIAVTPGAIMLASTVDNPNVFAVSGESPGYFPLDRRIAIDSRDGRGIIGAVGHLNSLFLFKRNGTWAVTGTGVRPVNEGTGCGGGAAVYDNVVFGAGDRGVQMFNGASFSYISDQLEGDYAAADITEPGLLAQQGAFYYPNSQYWLSVRNRGDRFNRFAYVLHTASGQSPAWTKLDLPLHTTLGLLTDAATDRPSLCIGTSCGHILALTPSANTDAVPDMPGNKDAGETLGREITTLRMTGFWREMRGATIHFYNQAGTFLLKSRIRRVYRIAGPFTVFHVEHDLPPLQNVTYVVGGFDSYWTSPWIATQQFGSYVKVEAVDLDFEPVAGLLRFSHATAVVAKQAGVTYSNDRQFDDALLAPESRTVQMDDGFLEQPIPINRRQQGRYFRFRFGTFVSADGATPPFSVTGYALRQSWTGTRGAPT